MKELYLKQVGERLSRLRIQKGISRQRLGELAGISSHSVVIMERGDTAVGIEDAVKICRALNCSMEYLLTGGNGAYGVFPLSVSTGNPARAQF